MIRPHKWKAPRSRGFFFMFALWATGRWVVGRAAFEEPGPLIHQIHPGCRVNVFGGIEGLVERIGKGIQLDLELLHL
jgi:hypothetical protein